MLFISQDPNGNLWQVSINTDGSITTAPAVAGTPVTPNTFRDSNGQLWQLSVNTDGSCSTTPIPDSPVVPAPNDFTTTLQDIANLCSTHVDLMPLANVGGYQQEPALSLSNDTLQELLSEPYDWKFNSKSTTLLPTMPARQDYLFGGASAFVPGFGGVAIGLVDGASIVEDASNNVTVKCMQQHNFTVGQTVFMVGNTVAAYNSLRIETPTYSGWTNGWVITAIIDPYTFQFVHAQANLGVSGAPGIFDCSWLEDATMYDLSSTDPVPYEWEVSAVKHMKRDSQLGRPEKICLLSQANGVLKLRIKYIPQSPCYGITVHYQMKAPIKTDLSQNWYPFPDEFGFVYHQKFLAMCYRFLNHARTDVEMQKAEQAVNKALGKDDVEESDQYVTPERSLMGDYLW